MAYNYGTFVGKLKKPTSDKMSFVATAKSNENVLLLNGSIETETGSVFVKMMGFKQDPLSVSIGKGERIEVPWDKRFDETIMDKVPSFAKTSIKIGNETKEFLSDWDAIKYLDEHYDEYKDTQIALSIQWDKNVYNGEARDQFSIQGMYPSKEGVKSKLGIKTQFFWNKDSIDDTDWDTDKILRVNGYIKSYDRDEKKDLFFPQTVVLNCSKIDFDNEHQKAIVDYRLKYLKTKSSTFQECDLECAFVIGAEKKEDGDFDESMLSDTQKEQVALGLKTVDDFRTGGTVYGEFKTELRLTDFSFKKSSHGDYSDGPVDSGLTQEELEEHLWSGAKFDEDDDFTDIDGAAEKKLEDLFM